MADDYLKLPEDLPRPLDDGAADHLPGTELPAVSLAATSGGEVDLAALAGGLLVAYVYPRTGTPGQPLPDGWNDIPGARGCTPQSCAYRDALAQFEQLGATLVGISAQSAAEQAEFSAREHIPFPLLTFVAEAGRIVKAFYPVFPPDRDAATVRGWLRLVRRGRLEEGREG